MRVLVRIKPSQLKELLGQNEVIQEEKRRYFSKQSEVQQGGKEKKVKLPWVKDINSFIEVWLFTFELEIDA
jgi:hypothetical protein